MQGVLSSKAFCKHSDMIISMFFQLLGWRVSKDKLLDYSSCCKALGTLIDLRQAAFGKAFFTSADSRRSELLDALDKILESGVLKPKECERLKSRLQFASGQLFRRKARSCLKTLGLHANQSSHEISVATRTACEHLRDLFLEATPREVRGSLGDVFHCFVDASFEPDGGYSGIGGCLYASTGEAIAWFGCEVEQVLLKTILGSGDVERSTAIYELECVAAAVALEVFGHLLAHKNIVLFSDNQGVQGTLIRCWSDNKLGNGLARMICCREEQLQVFLWLERVPSSSNPSVSQVQSSQNPSTLQGSQDLGAVLSNEPLLLQSAIRQHLHNSEGIITQAGIHKAHLAEHCGSCGRWIADAGMIKTHILRVHKNLAPLITAEFHKASSAFKHLLTRNQPCSWCGRKVHGTERHSSQCPVLFQLVLESIRQKADSAVPQAPHIETWPMPSPVANIAACLHSPVPGNRAPLQDMATVAKASCLTCGESLQDIQAWRRHIKAKHVHQSAALTSLLDSNTLLMAHVSRPCPWCQVESTEKSVCPCSNFASDMTTAVTPMETTPEQKLASVWGLSAPLAAALPTPQRQNAGVRPKANTQPNKFRKGQGKGKQTQQSKRARDQDDEELVMDTDNLDEETLRSILRVLVRAASRHEQQLTSLEADRSYVIFLETGNHGMIDMMIQASQTWHQQYEAGTVKTALRATLWGLCSWNGRPGYKRSNQIPQPCRQQNRPTG